MPTALRALTRLAALAALVSACDRRPTSPPAVPTRLEARVVPGPGGGPTGAPGTADVGAVPTWTLPPGVMVPPSVGGTARAPSLGSASAEPPVAAPPVEAAMPVPTSRPPAEVGEDGPAPDPDIVALLQQVDPNRLGSDVRSLVALGPRSARGGPGLTAAREWLHGRLASLGDRDDRPVLVEDEELPASGGVARANVVASLPGIGTSKRLVYLVAHYDSRGADAGEPAAPAPGADDNASGVATILEVARLMATRQWDATVRVLATADGEAGREGGRRHARLAADMRLPVAAVLVPDIVGASRAPDGTTDTTSVRAFSDGPDGSASRRLGRYARLVAERYGGPAVAVQPVADRSGRTGDHRSFAEAGFPALRLTAALEDESRQHNAGDTVDRLDPAYHAAVTRLVLAMAANLALAPAAPADAPVLADGDGEGTLRVSWTPSTDAGVAGHFVAWRPVDDQEYGAVRWATGTEAVLTGLPDGPVAVAVAASDDRGHASTFSPEARR